MIVLFAAKPEYVAAVKERFELGDTKLASIPSLEPKTMLASLATIRKQQIPFVVLHIPSIVEVAGKKGLQEFLGGYLKELGSERLIVVDEDGTLDQSRGVRERSSLVRDLADSDCIPFSLRPVAEPEPEPESEIEFVFEDEDEPEIEFVLEDETPTVAQARPEPDVEPAPHAAEPAVQDEEDDGEIDFDADSFIDLSLDTPSAAVVRSAPPVGTADDILGGILDIESEAPLLAFEEILSMTPATAPAEVPATAVPDWEDDDGFDFPELEPQPGPDPASAISDILGNASFGGGHPVVEAAPGDDHWASEALAAADGPDPAADSVDSILAGILGTGTPAEVPAWDAPTQQPAARQPDWPSTPDNPSAAVIDPLEAIFKSQPQPAAPGTSMGIPGLEGIPGFSGGGAEPEGGRAAAIEVAGSTKRGFFSGLADKLAGPDVVQSKALFPLDPNCIPESIGKTTFITFWAPKGGTGKTTGAMGIANYISWGLNQGAGRHPVRVLVIDLDEFADAYMQMDSLRKKGYGNEISLETLPNVKKLHDNLASVNSWDEVKQYLQHDPDTGLFVLLPQPNTVDSYENLDAEAYARIVTKIQKHFDFIIFDCGPHLLSSMNGLAPYAITLANVKVLIGDQTFQTIVHTVKFFASIAKRAAMMLTMKDSFIYVVNKYNPKAKSSLGEIHNVLDRYVSEIIDIPFDDLRGLESSAEGHNIIFSNSKSIKLAYKRLAEAVLLRVKAQQSGIVYK